MSAFTFPTSNVVRQLVNSFNVKEGIIRAKGPSSYDTGGSVFDVSSAQSASLGADGCFTVVEGVELIGVEAVGAALYRFTYLRDTAGAPATGKLVGYRHHDIDTSGNTTPDQTGEVASTTDLSSLVFIFRVLGR